MSERTERLRAAILRALGGADGPLGASRLAGEVAALGIDAQPRTVRSHLCDLDREGLTRTVSRRRGRELTPRGREELEHANVVGKIGFVAARVDNLGYRMTFDLATGRGLIVANVAWLAESDLPRALVHLEPVVRANLGMGTRFALARGGERLGGHPVPEGRVALGPVCSVSLNGILLKHGIPVTSRFGGLIEMRERRPLRFVELIEYRGTTIDPLEAFVRAGLTSVARCARTGHGVVGASFREVPTLAVPEVQRLHRAMRRCDLSALLAVGRPGQPLLGLPVAEGHTGILVMAGLNPIAALHEGGVPVTLRSLAGLHPYEAFLPFADLALRGRRESPLID